MTDQANWIARRLPGQRAHRGREKPRSEFRRVLHLFVHFAGGRKLYLLALGMLVFEAITSVFEAYPLAFLIDFLRDDRPGLNIDVPFLTNPQHETVAVLTFGLIVLVSVNSLADSMAEIYLARGGRNLGYNIREALYHKLQRLSLAFHDQRRTGDMLTRVTSDVTALEEFIVKSFGDLAGGVLLLFGTLIFLVVASWQVAIVAILIVPVMSLISNYFSERIKVASKRQRSHEGDLASSAQEMLTSIRVVQTYGRSTYEERRFAGQSRQSMEAALETAGLQAKFSWVVAVMEALATTVVVWMGLWLIGRGRLTVGTLVLFVILIENMFKPTKKIIREWTKIGKIYAAAERIAEVLDREPTVTDRPDAVDAPPLRGDLRFRQVSFAYQLEAEDVGDRPADTGRRVALEHVSFSAAPGEVVALIGHSGAGKSTMAQLIPRLYDPDEGVVLVDGHDIRTFTLASLRSQIGVVLQDTVLFSGTVAENIAYGREDASREQVVEAARRANAHDFIVELPEGYDTMLGERAANLSGGQRQRIAIARAFVRNAPILILDEPTTGLDTLATEQVVKGLRSLIKGKTTIIISHNLRLIRSADRILVVEGGRIVQSGTHDELSRRPGAYAEFGIRDAGGPGDLVEAELDGEPAVKTVSRRFRRQVDRARRFAEAVSGPFVATEPPPKDAVATNGGAGRPAPKNGHGANGVAHTSGGNGSTRGPGANGANGVQPANGANGVELANGANGAGRPRGLRGGSSLGWPTASPREGER